MSDAVDKALQDLAVFAADSWSNNAIVERINAVRKLRASEIEAGSANNRHSKAMRDDVFWALGLNSIELVK